MKGIADIKRIIPHRYPILSVDRVAIVEPAALDPSPDVPTGNVEFISGIRNVSVLGRVYPGDVVEHRVELVRAVGDAAILTGTSLVDGRPVLQVGTSTFARRTIAALLARPGTEEP